MQSYSLSRHTLTKLCRDANVDYYAVRHWLKRQLHDAALTGGPSKGTETGRTPRSRGFPPRTK